MIENADIERLLEALGIDGQRRGGKIVAVCPFPEHADTKPSWYIRDAPGEDLHGLYYCSCAKGGNVYTLVCELVGIDRKDPAAVKAWLKEHGVIGDAIAAESFTHAPQAWAPTERPPFRMPPEFEQRPFDRWPSPFRRYLEKRGVTEAQVARYGIGYAVAGDLEGRVVVPIRGARGDLRSYVARAIGKSVVRYLTPELSEHPRPGAVFGAEHWGDDRGVVVLTEGAFNALACERAGARAGAALGGSNVEAEHVSALMRFRVVVVATDQDNAGNRARAALVEALAPHVEIRALEFPKGIDANDLPETELRAMLEKVC